MRGTPGEQRGCRGSFPSPSPTSLPPPEQQQHAPGKQNHSSRTRAKPLKTGVLAHDPPSAPRTPDGSRVAVRGEAGRRPARGETASIEPTARLRCVVVSLSHLTTRVRPTRAGAHKAGDILADDRPLLSVTAGTSAWTIGHVSASSSVSLVASQRPRLTCAARLVVACSCSRS